MKHWISNVWLWCEIALGFIFVLLVSIIGGLFLLCFMAIVSAVLMPFLFVGWVTGRTVLNVKISNGESANSSGAGEV